MFKWFWTIFSLGAPDGLQSCMSVKTTQEVSGLGGAEKNIFLAPPRAIIPDARTLGTYEDAVYLNDLTKKK